jgi:hypothetical protein
MWTSVSPCPTAFISGVTTVGACDRLSLDGRDSLGDQGRALAYEWGVGAAPRALVLAVAAQSAPVLDIDQALLKVRRCRLTVSKAVLKAPMVSALEATI